MTNLIKNFFTDHHESTPINERLWTRIVWVSGIFSFIICLLLIANFVQVKKMDPVNMTVINSLVERLSENPSDTKLRDEIRVLDLLARKAYFTNRWQIKTGGFLLLSGVIVMIIALQVISLAKKKDPRLDEEKVENDIVTGKNARKWIAISGALFLVLALVLAWYSQDEIQKKFEKASVPAFSDDYVQEEIMETPVVATPIPDSVAASKTPEASPVKDETLQKPVLQDNSTPSKGENFPNFRGPGGLGIAVQKNVPTNWDGASGENILWKSPVPLPGYNSPIIWGDKLFLTGADASKREVYCFDRNTGKILWTALVQNISGSPAQAPKVSGETGYSAPTAATDGKAIYAIFSNGDLVALDLNGKKLWEKNLGMPQNHYGHSSSLMIWKKLLIIQYDQRTEPKLIALSAATGEVAWSTLRQVKISWASPIIVNTGKRTEIILAAEPYIASYNPENGEELWKLDAIAGEVGPSSAYANGIVYSVNDYSKLSAIRIGDQPEMLWESDEYLSDIPSPVATDKYLFLATSYGVAVCYDALTGTKYWEKEFINSIFASPIISEEKVYMMDKTGIMHIFKADKEFSIISEPKLGEKSACTPAFSNGRIYIRGDKNLYCIGK
jgi:outer membrane protein assembly factor BamB/preprotein translocase subunit SecG